jgi:hypothetical protein
MAYRDAGGSRRIVALSKTRPMTVGRSSSCDVALEWDTEVSSLHAELERRGGVWVLADDGLSRNGTWLNEERVIGRRRLRDRDAIRCGQSVLTFRDPAAVPTDTAPSIDALEDAPHLSPAQQRVFLALCRPLSDRTGFMIPATNQEIADELSLSLDAVKTHMRTLFKRFGLRDLPQNRKRLRLAEVAVERGVVPAPMSVRGG